MTPPQKQRFRFLAFSGMSVFLGIGLLLFCLQEHMMYFYTPSDLNEDTFKTKYFLKSQKIRLGGLVKKGTVRQEIDSLGTVFDIWDQHNTITVFYQGILPDLFKEGQGVVVEGFLRHNGFQATLVLAKHDENYRPPEMSKMSQNIVQHPLKADDPFKGKRQT